MREVEEELIFNENIFLSHWIFFFKLSLFYLGLGIRDDRKFVLKKAYRWILALHRCHQADLCLRNTLIFAYGADYVQKVV